MGPALVRVRAAAVEPIEVVPAYELVVRRIRRAILLGSYLPGDVLPAERTLAGQLGVSRVTVREAIRILQGEGYIRTRRGAAGGASVLDQREPVERLRARLRERLAELDGILDFRRANECAAARLAAARRTEADLRAMAIEITRLRQSENLGQFRQADSAFHLAIADAARNPMLREAIEEARVAMFLPLDSNEFEILLGPSLRGHQRILTAIDAGNPRRAERAMAAHIEGFRKEFHANLGVKD